MTSEELAWKIKRHGVEMTHISHGSHIGAILSVSDIIAVLYADILNIDPQDPRKADRDRLILSKGHAGAAIYAALAEKGFFPVGELATHYRDGSRLSGHVSHKGVPGVEFSTGSLGHGLPVAVGMALEAKMERKDYQVYIVMGDGECDEGSVWEASMLAGHRKLDNLVVIVDNNNLQIDGKITDVNSPYPIDKKFEAFNFHVINIDGNDFDQIRAAFKEARETKGMPTAIIAKTVKGKGVSFMENVCDWHGKAPNDEQYEVAMADLEKVGEALCQK